MRYDDIDPRDIDPETGRPYANYSSPALDTSFHDHEMGVDEPPKAPLDAFVEELQRRRAVWAGLSETVDGRDDLDEDEGEVLAKEYDELLAFAAKLVGQS